MHYEGRFQEFIDSIGVSQAKIARILDMSNNHINRVCRNLNSLSTQKLVILHDKYNLDIHWLVTGKPYHSKNQDDESIIEYINTLHQKTDEIKNILNSISNSTHKSN